MLGALLLSLVDGRVLRSEHPRLAQAESFQVVPGPATAASSLRPGSSATTRLPPPRLAELKPGDWTCAECGASPVFASRDECFRCGAPRPEGWWDDAEDPEERSSRAFRGGRQRAAERPRASGPEVEEKLDAWCQAKRSRDYATSDKIRDELRRMGVDAEIERPPGRESRPRRVHPRGDRDERPRASGPEVEEKLDAWCQAKRSRDYATSDRIRDELRRMGVDAEIERPGGKSSASTRGSRSQPTGRPSPEGGAWDRSPEFRTNFEGTRVFVENLDWGTDWATLKDHFRRDNYPVVYASVSEDRDGNSKGQGIVQFETSHAASHAIEHMTGTELDGRFINVRPDFQEARQRGAADAPRARAQEEQPWMVKEWSRVAGTDDSPIDEAEVLRLLKERQEHRESRDYDRADEVLDQLADMGVSLDDARRQKVWWTGRRLDGKEPDSRGAAAGRGRRKWYGDFDDKDGYNGDFKRQRQW